MQIEYIKLDKSTFHSWLMPSLNTFIAAMNYPPESINYFFPNWLRQMNNPNWKGIAAVTKETTNSSPIDSFPIVGISFGFDGNSSQWWHQQLSKLSNSNQSLMKFLDDYFSLAELHVHPNYQGKGIGTSLLKLILKNVTPTNVLLSTPEVKNETSRAWSLYRKMGFNDLVRNFVFPDDERLFAILGRKLPL